MRTALPAIALAAVAALSTPAWAQQPAPGQDHAAHHPAGGTASSGPVETPSAKPEADAAGEKATPTAASSGKGMGGDMAQMPDQAHKPGGMHDQMHDRAHKPGAMHDQMHGPSTKTKGVGAGSAMPGPAAGNK